MDTREIADRFLVAFSFSGKERDLVREIAGEVENRLGRETVFFDEWFQHYLAGQDADLKLQEIYGEKSELVVVGVSAPYGEKPWTRMEHEAIRARFMQRRDRGEVLPIRVGDGKVPGIPFNTIAPDVREMSTVDAAKLVTDRLHLVISGGYTSHSSRSSRTVLTSGTFSPPAEATNPGTLLDARYQAVPFVEEARKEELSSLSDWCEGGKLTSARLFYGPGGAGKTRLFIEWVKRLLGQGWNAGFLPERVTEAEIDLVCASDRPTLIVVDYADARPDLLTLLSQVTSAERPSAYLRIALLARSVGAWWNLVRERDVNVGELVRERAPMQLGTITLVGDLRQRVFSEAVEAFSKLRGVEARQLSFDFSDDRFGRALYLHIAALMAVEIAEISIDALLEQVVFHEQRYWIKQFEASIGPRSLDVEKFLLGARRTVAALTLVGGATSLSEAEAVRVRVGGPSDDGFSRFLGWLYPGQDSGDSASFVSGLQPDLLGEELVSRVIADDTSSNDYLDHVLDGATGSGVGNCFIILSRLAQRGHQLAYDEMRRLLNKGVSEWWRPALNAVLALGDETATTPLGRILHDALCLHQPTSFASEAFELVPYSTTSLSEVGVWAAQRLLDELEESESTLARRAHLTNHLANRLDAVGQKREGLAASRNAVQLYRDLTRQDMKHRKGLASALSNLSNRLSTVGRDVEAVSPVQEAVELARELVNGDARRFEPALAMFLNNLGNRHCDVENYPEALTANGESLVLRRKFAESHSADALHNLAKVLSNRGHILIMSGCPSDALECLSEAVSIRRRLVADFPDAHTAGLGGSLVNLAQVQSDLGCHDEGLASAKEAEGYFRAISESSPAAYTPELAASLTVLSTNLLGLNLLSEASSAAEDAINTYDRAGPQKERRHRSALLDAKENLVQAITGSGEDPTKNEFVQLATRLIAQLDEDDE